jgi:hypothetical protein
LAWPLAFVVVALGSLRTWVALVEGRRAERMESADRDTRFLAGERDVDDRVKMIKACAEARAIPTSLEKQLAEMIDAASVGHDPVCSYCNCGFAKAGAALKELPLLLAGRALAVESRVKTKLRGEGWAPPDDVHRLTEGTD